MFYNPMKLIRKFHKAFGIFPNRIPGTIQLRSDLIKEESDELLEALDVLKEIQNHRTQYADFADYKEAIQRALEHVAKEASDVLVVVYGMFDTLEIPAEKSFKEVMRANMSKLGDDGKPVYRLDGKVLKGPAYKEADMRGVLTGEWI